MNLPREIEDRIVERVLQRIAAVLSPTIAPASSEPEYLTPVQVQERFSIQPATVRQMVRRGDIVGKPGRPFLVESKSLRRYISGH